MEGLPTHFPNSESMQLYECNDEEHELEVQQDEQRRYEEIENLLTNAFDDLDNDDVNSSINSSRSTVQVNNSRSLLDTPGNVSCRIPDNASLINKGERNNYVYDRQDTLLTDGGDSYVLNNRPIGILHESPQISESHTELFTRKNYKHYPRSLETPSNHFDKNNDQHSTVDSYIPAENNTIPAIKFYSDNSSHPGWITNNENTCDTVNDKSKDQLDVLNVVKTREIEKLTAELIYLQNENSELRQMYQDSLVSKDAELQLSNKARDEAKAALSAMEQEVQDYKLQISKLQNINKTLDASKQALLEEVVAVKNTMFDMEQKIHLLEDSNSLKTNNNLNEKYLQQIHEKYDLQFRNMQMKIETMSQELSQKKASYKMLEQKYYDMCNTNKMSSTNSTETISKLTQALKNCEAKCEELESQKNSLEHRFQTLKASRDTDEGNYPVPTRKNTDVCVQKYQNFKANDCEASRPDVNADCLQHLQGLSQEYVISLRNQALKRLQKVCKLVQQVNNSAEGCDELERKVRASRTALQKFNVSIRTASSTETQVKEPDEDRVKSQQSKRIVELLTDLQQTRNELDHVKHLYIDICALKDNLIINHRNELQSIKAHCQKMNLQWEIKLLRDNAELHARKNKTLCDKYQKQLQCIQNLERKFLNEKESVDVIKNTIVAECQKDENSQTKTVAPVLSTKFSAEDPGQSIIPEKTCNSEKHNSSTTEIPQVTSINKFDDEIYGQEDIYKKVIDQIIKERDNMKTICLHLRLKMEHFKKVYTLQVERIKSLENELKNAQEAKVTSDNTADAREADKRLTILEEKYKASLLQLQKQSDVKDRMIKSIKEKALAEHIKYCAFMKKQEEVVANLISTKMSHYQKEISAKNLYIGNLQNEIQQFKTDMEENKSSMAKVMSTWAQEMEKMRLENTKLREDVSELQRINENYLKKIDELKKKALEDANSFRQKYEAVKKAARKYKIYAMNQEKHIANECRRIDVEYREGLERIKEKLENFIYVCGDKLIRQIDTAYS